MSGKFEVLFDAEGTRPSSAGRSTTLKVLGTLAIAGLTLGLAACGDDSSGGGSPEDLADSYADAVADQDCGAYESLLSEEAAAEFDKDECEEDSDAFDDVEHIGTEIDQNGSEASIELTFEVGGEEIVDYIDAVEEDGSWVIS